MTKRYFSHSDIAFNVAINGRRVHIKFDPKFSGGSVFMTDSKDVQNALERCPDFGTLFNVEMNAESCNSPKNEIKPQSDNKYTVIEAINSCSDAKSFLKEQGYEGATLRSKESILTAAESLNFQFPNL